MTIAAERWRSTRSEKKIAWLILVLLIATLAIFGAYNQPPQKPATNQYDNKLDSKTIILPSPVAANSLLANASSNTYIVKGNSIETNNSIEVNSGVRTDLVLFSNRGTEEITFQVIEIIPKSVAASASQIKFSSYEEASITVLEDDPIITYYYNLQADETKVFEEVTNSNSKQGVMRLIISPQLTTEEINQLIQELRPLQQVTLQPDKANALAVLISATLNDETKPFSERLAAVRNAIMQTQTGNPPLGTPQPSGSDKTYLSINPPIEVTAINPKSVTPPSVIISNGAVSVSEDTQLLVEQTRDGNEATKINFELIGEGNRQFIIVLQPTSAPSEQVGLVKDSLAQNGFVDVTPNSLKNYAGQLLPILLASISSKQKASLTVNGVKQLAIIVYPISYTPTITEITPNAGGIITFNQREFQVFTSTAEKDLYKFEPRFEPVGCGESLRIKMSSNKSKTNGQEVVHFENIQVEGSLDLATESQCRLLLKITTFQTERIIETENNLEIKFNPVFDRAQTFSPTNKLAISYHYDDPTAQNAIEEVRKDYEYLTNKSGFGQPKYLAKVYLFRNAEELKKYTGLPFNSASAIIAAYAKGCPALVAHELHHAIVGQPFLEGIKPFTYSQYYENPLNTVNNMPLFILEGTAQYYAYKATGYYLTSAELPNWIGSRSAPLLDMAGNPLLDDKQQPVLVSLNDLDQITSPKEEQTGPATNMFDTLLNYEGGTAFFAYAEGRFGEQALITFFKNLRQNNDFKTAMQAAFKQNYSQFRLEWNQVLNKEITKLTPIYLEQKEKAAQAKPNATPQAKQITDYDANAPQCINPPEAQDYAPLLNKEIANMTAQLDTAKDKCTAFKLRFETAKTMANQTPPMALFYAHGAFNAAKADGCLVKK